MGAGLILYLNAFGFKRTERFFTFTTFKIVSCVALSFYALSKAYSFFTGANHLPSIITTGTPGMIFSAGLIPYLNIAVGLVVCCTMYAFYTLFRKGGHVSHEFYKLRRNGRHDSLRHRLHDAAAAQEHD